jgi:hypothetical protein
MIAGRSTALWGGLIAAVLNVAGAVVIITTNHPLDASVIALFAAVDALALAVIGILANVAATGTAFSRAANDVHRNW